MKADESPRERQRRLDQARVDTFVVRARRIAAHSLAQDPDELKRLALGSMDLGGNGDGTTYIRFRYPDEEVVESAAARVRPLMLNDVSLPAVLKAITSLTAESEDRDLIKDWAAKTRKEWRVRMGDGPHDDQGFVMFATNTTTGESQFTDHVELGTAWIYGDVVHHDPEHLERTSMWGVGERFRAAVPLVAFVMRLALMVLRNIREMERRGALTVKPEAWTVDVVAEPTYERQVDLYFAPKGTELPTSAKGKLAAVWTPVGKVGISDQAADENE